MAGSLNRHAADDKKKTDNAINTGKKSSFTQKKYQNNKGSFPFSDKTLAMRLIVSSLLLFPALILRLPYGVSIAFLLISPLLSGYDLFLTAVIKLKGKQFTDPSVLICFTAVAGFFLGFFKESAALIIIFRIGMILIAYTSEKTAVSAEEFIDPKREDILTAYESACPFPGNDFLAVEKTARNSANAFFKLGLLVALAYAILLPIISDFGIKVALHRSITIILIACPLSVTAGISSVGRMGLGESASRGFVFRNAAILESVAECKTVIFEEQEPVKRKTVIQNVRTDLVERDTFLNLVYNLIYDSTQDFAEIIRNSCHYDHIPDAVTDFREISGFGVEGKISRLPVLFGTPGFIKTRGIEIPEDITEAEGQYCLAISGKFAGSITLGRVEGEETADLNAIVTAARNLGNAKYIAVTHLPSDDIAINVRFSEFDNVLSINNKRDELAVVNEICSSLRFGSIFISSGSFDPHSAAKIDMHLGTSYNNDDALVFPGCLSQYPEIIRISQRTEKLAKQDIVFVLLVKAILILLTLIGYCNLWFSIYIDMAAALATILNAARVSTGK